MEQNTAKAHKEEAPTPEKKQPSVNFIEDDSSLYRERTRRNAEAADITVAFAVDFNTAGERCTKTVAGDKYVPVIIPPVGGYFRTDGPKDTAFLKAAAEKIEAAIMDSIGKNGGSTLDVRVNVAGNGIYTLMKHAITQEMADRLVLDVFDTIEKRPNVHISSIRSGGQTGIDESGIKAAVSLGVEATVLAPQGWKFRGEDGVDISDEKAFKARFPGESKKEEKKAGRGKIVVVNVKSYGGPTEFEAASKNNVYIGRRPEGNILGNPFTHIQTKQTLAQFVVGSRQESVDRYSEYFDNKYGTDVAYTKAIDALYDRVKGGEDLTLGCWCKPLACHGDIIKAKLEKKLDEEMSFRQRAGASVAAGKIRSAGELRDGWALVQANNGKFNYANAEGKFMTKDWFDSAAEFKDGQAVTTRHGQTATINANGIVVSVKNEMSLHR